MPRPKRESASVKSSAPKRQRGIVVSPLPEPPEEKANRLLKLPIDWIPLTRTLQADDPLLVEEYKKFLVLKVINADIKLDGLKLSPSGPIDDVWHSHMLLPRHYADVCAGHLISQLTNGFNKVADHVVTQGNDLDIRTKS